MNHFILIQFHKEEVKQVFASETKQGVYLDAKKTLVKQFNLELDGADLFCQLIIMEKAVYDSKMSWGGEYTWEYYEL